jgi:hypothetical protein
MLEDSTTKHSQFVENAATDPRGKKTSVSDYWFERIARIPTVSGSLAFLASHRDASGHYHDRESECRFGEAETERVLGKLHAETFVGWLAMNLQQQSRDLTCYFSMDARAARYARAGREWIARLLPPGTNSPERELFTHDIELLLDRVIPKQEAAEDSCGEPDRLEKIA